MLKKIVAISLISFAVFALGYWFLQQNVQATDTLVLGTMSGWPPYVSINNQGEYEGLDINIANEIARRLGRKLTIKDMDTAALIIALKQGSVDFVMTGLSITPRREAAIAMIPYQGEIIKELPLVFWKTAPEGVASFEDLKKLAGKTICVEPGSSQAEILETYAAGVTIKQIDPFAAMLELKYGKVAAVLLENNLLSELKAKYPELVSIALPLKESEYIKGNGIGVAKSNTDLIAQINTIIDDLKAEGFIAERERYWFKKGQS